MKLIVGLGNPGPQYAATRHNVGWRVAEELARRAGAQTWKEKFEAAVTDTRRHDQKIVLARPLTFMNESGRSVRQLMDFWKVEAEDLLVVLDDMAIEVARVRLRPEGTDGGHKGLRSVIAHVGHERFARLRVGIGPPPLPEEHVDFVLSPFTSRERPIIEEAIALAADAAECWIIDGPEEAMNRFNRGAGA